MYTLSRLLEPLLLPVGLVALGMLVCFALSLRRKARASATAMIIVFCVYYLASTWPAASLLVGLLERQVPVAERIRQADGVSVIVVLAGAASNGRSGPAELGGAGWRRLWRGVEVFWELEGRVPLIFSGGTPKGDLVGPGDLARTYVRRFGIPEDRFWLEGGSRTTYESGLAVKKLLDQRFPEDRTHRILLVTSAWHMPRAVAVFDRLAVETVPVPCDFPSSPRWSSITSFVPTYEALSTTSVALHEWIGLVVYRLRAGG